MDIAKTLFDGFMNSPAFQGAIMSIVVSQLRKVSKTLDSAAVDPQQVKVVQSLVAVLSVVSSVLIAYTQHKLEGIDFNSLMTSLQVAAVALMGAFGTHEIGKQVKSNAKDASEAIKANPNLGPVGKYPFQVEFESLFNGSKR